MTDSQEPKSEHTTPDPTGASGIERAESNGAQAGVQDDRACFLAVRYLESSITDGELAELNVLLSSDAAALETFIDTCRTAQLFQELSTSSSVASARQSLQLVSDDVSPSLALEHLLHDGHGWLGPVDVSEKQAVALTRMYVDPADRPKLVNLWLGATGQRQTDWSDGTQRRRIIRQMVVSSFSTAAILVIAVVIGMVLRQDAPLALPVGRLAKTAGAAFESGVQAGQTLKTGRQVLTRGTARIDFDAGAQVVLEAPAEVELHDAGGMTLLRGKLSAYVPPSAVGFTVRTPRAQVIDLGTRFAVSVNDLDDTEVHVFEGRVELRPIIDGEGAEGGAHSKHALAAGRAVSFETVGSKGRDIPARKDRFVTAVPSPTSARSIVRLINGSFEMPQAVKVGAPNQPWSLWEIQGWTVKVPRINSGVVDVTTSSSQVDALTPPDGTQWAFVGAGDTIYQRVGELRSGMTYRLSCVVSAQAVNTTIPQLSLAVLDDNIASHKVIASIQTDKPVVGKTTRTLTLEYESTIDSPIGKPLFVLVGSRYGQALVDQVRLTATPISESKQESVKGTSGETE